MTRAQVYTVAALLSLGIAATPRASAQMRESPSDYVVTGELVVTNAGKNQFRVVDHGGYFTAPAGTPLEELDGKPVRVELSRDGRVLQVTEKPIHVDPITHRYDIVTGQLVVTDAQARSFTIVGDGQLYVAPPGIDIESYAGRRVEVFTDEHGNVTNVYLASRSEGASATPVCSYSGQDYFDGSSLCLSGTQYSCQAGTWRSLGVACTALNRPACYLDGRNYSNGTIRCNGSVQALCERGQWRNLSTACLSDTTARLSNACMLGDARIASGVAICRNGTAFRCAAGEWVTAGTTC